MKRYLSFSLLSLPHRLGMVGVILALVLAGCGPAAPSRVLPDAPDPNAASRAVDLYDKNGDGLLDSQELEKAPGLKSAIKQVDTNGDGKISADEINARIAQWRESKMGRSPVIVTVTRNGKPLAGAVVKLVPEPFLGSAFHEGSGTTDSTGQVAPSAESAGAAKLPGLSPGFYRVEITKDGDSIPANYNKETAFGIEVASGSEIEDHPPHFDLTY